VERGGVRQEIVAYEKAEEYKIIYYPLEIESKRHLSIQILEFQVQILSSDVEFDKLELY